MLVIQATGCRTSEINRYTSEEFSELAKAKRKAELNQAHQEVQVYQRTGHPR